MNKNLLVVILAALLILSMQKSVNVACSTTCKVKVNCTAACLTYTSTNLSQQYCLDTAQTGRAPITTCPVGLPLTIQITGCSGPNVPNCTTGTGCCLQFSATNQCISALTSQATCTTTPITGKSTCGTCQSSPTCASKLCNRLFLNNIFIQQVCLTNSTFCQVFEQTVQSCPTATCAGGCCGSGTINLGVCNNQYTFNSFGVIGKELCIWGFEGTMIKYLGIALAVAFMLVI